MFGVVDDVLIEGLENLRKRLCLYGPTATTCDCKFGASGKGEMSGCPELRQAIAYLSGQREEVVVFERKMENSAKNAMDRIKREVDRYFQENSDA